jgi:hypothetical protein
MLTHAQLGLFTAHSMPTPHLLSLPPAGPALTRLCQCRVQAAQVALVKTGDVVQVAGSKMRSLGGQLGSQGGPPGSAASDQQDSAGGQGPSNPSPSAAGEAGAEGSSDEEKGAGALPLSKL